MTTAASAGSALPLSDDALIEFSRASESSRADQPSLSRAVALLFAMAAVGALFLPSHRGASAVAIVVCLFSYAVARSVQVEFTTFYLVPTEAIFVAMWFVLPLRLLPLTVVAAMLLAELPSMLRTRRGIERTVVLNLASAWFSIGPALVLYAAGAHQPRWRDAPIYLAALAAQFVLDFASTLLLQRAAVGKVSISAHARPFLEAIGYDAMLAPLGLLAAFAAYSHPAAILLLLPVVAIVSRIASEREARHTHEIELKSAYQGTSYLLGDMIEADDEYTGEHSRDVVNLVLAVAQRLRLKPDELRVAEFTALLHDVGKVKVPAAIINKAGPLDADERALLNTHTIIGEEMLEPIGGLLGRVGRIVRSCHERWDGNGYPDRLVGEEIPLVARIVCACDAWSAMTTDRSYRKALSLEDATAELERGRGTHFDPAVVDALADALGL